MAVFSDHGKRIFTCDDIRDDVELLKLNFRKLNRTDEVLKAGGRDRRYEEYCQSLIDFLKQCKCNEIALKCCKCPEIDHEGHFCRCEGRNIQLAKQLRERGISPWNKQKDNKAEPERDRERSKREDPEMGCGTLNSMET